MTSALHAEGPRFDSGRKYVNGGLAQSVECVVSNDEAPGSKPGFSMFLSFDLNEELITSCNLSYVSRHFGRVVKAAAC